MADDADNASERIEAFTASDLAARPKMAARRPADGLCLDCGESIEDGRHAPTCVICAEEAEEEAKRRGRRGPR